MLGRLFDGSGVGTLDPVLAWPPIVWLSRILAGLGLAGATLLLGLLVGRLLRPTTIKAIFSGKLPRPKSLTAWGHKVEFLEQEVDAGTELDTRRDEQINALEQRVRKIVQLLGMYGKMLGAHREALEALLDENMEDHDDEGDEIRGQKGDTEEGSAT